MQVPIKLKRKWTRAILNAASDLLKAAINAVIVVPILAPTIYGNILPKCILPVAPNGTIIEVVIELDCIPAVKIVPRPKEFKVFLKKTS